jgi:quinoprotein glucose dehydrogenase
METEGGASSTRGVDFWKGGSDHRLFNVRGGYLYAIDLRGRALSAFGDNGRVRLVPEGARSFGWSSGPIVVGDVVVIAGNLDGAGDGGTQWKNSAAEDVRGFDARTGKLLWTFHVVPRPGEFGADTWGNDSGKFSGDLGSWCCISADESLGHVYIPLTAPTAAYYGGHRPGDNLFSNALVALDAKTGKRVWHFQTVHHDLVGVRPGRPADARRHPRRRPPHQGGDAAEQDRLPLRLRSHRPANRCGRSKSGRCRSRPCRARRRRRRSRSRPGRRRSRAAA